MTRVERFVGAYRAAQAKTLGRALPLRLGWDESKLDVMLACLRSKFSDVNLSARLIGTGDAELIEGNTWDDRFWGVCGGDGENHLGRLLMRVRGELSSRDPFRG